MSEKPHYQDVAYDELVDILEGNIGNVAVGGIADSIMLTVGSILMIGAATEVSNEYLKFGVGIAEELKQAAKDFEPDDEPER